MILYHMWCQAVPPLQFYETIDFKERDSMVRCTCQRFVVILSVAFQVPKMYTLTYFEIKCDVTVFEASCHKMCVVYGIAGKLAFYGYL